MKLSLASSILAGTSVGLSTSFVLDRHHVIRKHGIDTHSSLQYKDNKATDDADWQGLVVTDMGKAATSSPATTSTTIGDLIDPDDVLLVENLAFSLNLSEQVLEEKYQAWLTKYQKTAEPARYFNWKRNFLMQEVWNRTNGESFDLNEYGDYTKQEFDAMNQTSEAEEAVAVAEAAVASMDVASEQPIPDDEVSPAYYLSELPNKPKPKFKQVQTFSGGYQFVPVNTKEENTGITERRAPKPAPTQASARGNKAEPAATTAAAATTTNQGQRFRKVRLFSGGFMIVPNNAKN